MCVLLIGVSLDFERLWIPCWVLNNNNVFVCGNDADVVLTLRRGRNSSSLIHSLFLWRKSASVFLSGCFALSIISKLLFLGEFFNF